MLPWTKAHLQPSVCSINHYLYTLVKVLENQAFPKPFGTCRSESQQLILHMPAYNGLIDNCHLILVLKL